MQKDAKYGRDTDVNIDERVLISWVENHFGVSWTTIENGTNASGRNSTYAFSWEYIKDDNGNRIENDKVRIIRGTMELMVHAVAYQVTVQELGSWDPLNKGVYLPDRYWAVGFADTFKIEEFIFRYATVWDGKRTYSTQASNYVTQRDTHFAKK